MPRTIDTSKTAGHWLTRLCAANITAERRARGMTRRELAQKADKVPSAVSFIEAGVRGVTLPTLADLAEALGLAPALLLTEHTPCPSCSDQPPAGMTCNRCSRRSDTTDSGLIPAAA